MTTLRLLFGALAPVAGACASATSGADCPASGDEPADAASPYCLQYYAGYERPYPADASMETRYMWTGPGDSGAYLPLCPPWAYAPAAPPSPAVLASTAASHARWAAEYGPPQPPPAPFPTTSEAPPDAPPPPPQRALGKVPVLASTLCGPSTHDAKTDAKLVYDPLQGLSPAVPPDFIQARFGEAGTRCAQAKYQGQCFQHMREASERLTGYANPQATTVPLLVVQRGENISTVATWSELAAFLGPVDTLKEAALHATLRNYTVDCTFSTGEARGADWLVTARTGSAHCKGQTQLGHVLRVDRDGRFTVVSSVPIAKGTRDCRSEGGTGRRPAGAQEAPVAPPRDLGAHFARAAQLEAASVIAFEQIVRELEAFGAPASLVRRASRAARDEVRHAQLMGRLATQLGAAPLPPILAAASARDAFSFAHDNAVEGCVRETFGALVMAESAARAMDPEIVRVLRIIARDELRHAALSWDIAAWIESRLTASERAAVHHARARELGVLAASLRDTHEPLLGILAPEPARDLLAALGPHLLEPVWAVAA